MSQLVKSWDATPTDRLPPPPRTGYTNRAGKRKKEGRLEVIRQHQDVVKTAAEKYKRMVIYENLTTELDYWVEKTRITRIRK